MANDIKNNNVEEIDLLKLGKALWDRAWVLVICTLVGAGLAFGYTMCFITPMYQASALLYVNNNALDIGNTRVSISNGDLVAANGLISTYEVILKSRNTLEAVIEDGGLPYTYEQLSKMVSAGSVNDTAVLKITVTNRNPEMAAHITNTIVSILPDRISGIVEGSSVEIVDYAVPPVQPSSPNTMKNTAIGAMLGFVISAAIIVLRFLMDSTIREEEYLLETYKEIPVLSVIPDLTSDDGGSYYYYKKTKAKGGNKQ
ncbi:MAG: hypothetical protein IKT14_06570 [Clostridiales bacterium]|nr:hypothetical protein [Clostridiales bacterium]